MSEPKPSSPKPHSPRLSRFEMPVTERNELILSRTVERKTCRSCGSSLTPVFDLGPMFVNDFPRRLEDRGPKVPLNLAVCDQEECSLVQLTHTVPRDALYRTHYWYRSGVNEMMRKELADIVDWGLGFITTPAVLNVADIGANDGTLLAAVAKRCEGFPLRLAAWEPAENLAEAFWVALSPYRRRNLSVMLSHDYFPPSYDSLDRFDLIFSIAMFYDLEDPAGFVAAIRRRLNHGGVWVLQFQDLFSMLDTRGVDCACHEHLEYYTLHSLRHLLSRHELTIAGAVYSQSNGGSLRVAVCRQGDGKVMEDWINPEVRRRDAALSLSGIIPTFEWWRGEMEKVQLALLRAIPNTINLELLGASTKGNTLLQWLNLGPERVVRAIERAPEKAGRMTITGIPIVGEDGGYLVPSQTIRLVLPWHFKESLLSREREWLRKGGRLLFPLPHPREYHWSFAYGGIRDLGYARPTELPTVPAALAAELTRY